MTVDSFFFFSFPIQVYNDSRTCSPDASYKILLTLTGCSKDEFTCVDGNCIPMESRCNVDDLSNVNAG